MSAYYNNCLLKIENRQVIVVVVVIAKPARAVASHSNVLLRVLNVTDV